MAYPFANLVFLIAIIASPAVSQAPTRSGDPAKPAEPPKAKMTGAQKAAAWKGQRITILGDKPLRCPDHAGSFQSGLHKFEDKSAYAVDLQRAEYVGQTGAISEANAVGSQVEGIIDLDKGQRLRATARYIGFQEELQAARRWIGRNLWLKERKSLTPDQGLCLSASESVEIPMLGRLTITGAEFGTEFNTILLQVTTEDGQPVWLKVGFTYFLEQFAAQDHYELFGDGFYLDDPQKKHPNWGPNTWKLIRAGKVAVGMTEEQALMACGGKMDPRGFFLVSEAVSTIYGCRENKDFLVENGKVKEYFEFRRVP